MSKKNNKATKKRRHAHDLAMEKQAREAAQQKAEKAAAKLEHKAATQGGVVKPKRKSKAIRIRKGVKVKGIKVVDSETKREALQRLQAEAAARMMNVMGEDDDAVAAVPATTKALQIKRKVLRKKALKLKAGSKSSGKGVTGAAAGDAPAAMEA